MSSTSVLRVLPALLSACCLVPVPAADSFAMAEPTGALPVSDEQLRYLAQGVCNDLFLDRVLVTSCLEHFLHPSIRPTGNAPKVELKCQADRKATFLVNASEDYQLLVLVPNNQTNRILSSAVLNPGERVRSIYITDNETDHQIFSTKLSGRGSPGFWLPGDKVPSWTDVVATLTPREYHIQLTDLEPVEYDLKLVKGTFTWNNTDPTDQCFSVRNHCTNKILNDFLEKRIGPGQPHELTVDLALNDSCKFVVEGKYGKSELYYTTPSCVKEYCAPEIPKNVTVSFSRAYFGSGWDVQVSWQRPVNQPASYNVTLGVKSEPRVVVPGNATSAMFEHVEGDKDFNVEVVAINNLDNAYSNERAYFPADEQSQIGVVVSGAWTVVLLLAVLVVGSALWLKRRRRHVYFEDFEEKALKGGSGDTFSTEHSTSDPWEIQPDRLVLHEVLGEGAFGVVRRGSLAPGGRDVAVKTLKDYPSVEEVRSFRAEMELMKSVGVHPHVVSLAGCCSGQRLMIVAEYCARGDLLQYLRCAWDAMICKRNAKYYNNNIEDRNDLNKSKKEHSRLVINKLYDLQKFCDTELTSVDLLSYCRQIAMGMEFLAANRVVHRDLAARNVLVSADKTLKIADFGLSRDVYTENHYTQKGTGKLPIKWMALESLTHRIYTTQSDVWSFGVVVWEVVTVGGSPYPGVPTARLPRLLRDGYRMPSPKNCSKQLYEIMNSCWRERARERPTFADLHHQLDALLDCACVDDYLSLELEEEMPAMPRRRDLLPKSMCNWYKRSDISSRPLKAIQSNHYTSPPDSMNRVHLV